MPAALLFALPGYFWPALFSSGMPRCERTGLGNDTRTRLLARDLLFFRYESCLVVWATQASKSMDFYALSSILRGVTDGSRTRMGWFTTIGSTVELRPHLEPQWGLEPLSHPYQGCASPSMLQRQSLLRTEISLRRKTPLFSKIAVSAVG